MMQQTLTAFGIAEHRVHDVLNQLERCFKNVRFEWIDEFPEIHIRLYGLKAENADTPSQIEQAADWVAVSLGDHTLDKNGRSMPEVVGRLLLRNGLTVAVAESCTGGLIAHLLTGVAGSSEYFLFSAVTYSNRSKIDVLGVPNDIIERYGAVAEETAREMAEGTRRIGAADYGISTTGIAGPGGGTQAKPVGTVCIGVAAPGDRSYARRYHFTFENRSMNKRMFAFAALDLLRRELLTGNGRGGGS